MLRFGTACLLLLLTPFAAAEGKELKPKLGDIGGTSYAEVSESREVCRMAVEGRIALCLLNTELRETTTENAGTRPLPRRSSNGRPRAAPPISAARPASATAGGRPASTASPASAARSSREGCRRRAVRARRRAGRPGDAGAGPGRFPQRTRNRPCQGRGAGSGPGSTGDRRGRRLASHRGAGRRRGFRSRLAAHPARAPGPGRRPRADMPGHEPGRGVLAGTRRPAGLPFLVRLLRSQGKLDLVRRVP